VTTGILGEPKLFLLFKSKKSVKSSFWLIANPIKGVGNHSITPAQVLKARIIFNTLTK